MSSGAGFPIYMDASALLTPDSTLGHSLDDASFSAADAKSDRAGSVRNVMDSIEHDDIPLPRSPTMSHQSEDVISEMPEDTMMMQMHLASSDDRSSQYALHKQRSPFRSPSSVRALQMETPPPFNDFSSPRSYRHHRLSTTSRHSTPRSIRSEGVAVKPKPTPTKMKEFPLVLIHVTVMPLHFPYSQETMEAVLPPAIIDSYKLLREKVSDTVLERGILLPHPKDDYELLEERLLESLELKSPRILKCGHFHCDSGDSSDDCDGDDEEGDEDEGFEGSDTDRCDDCGRKTTNDYHGAGSLRRRWNIKIYAANGLMRAGAWTAAWREMERIDVEISPWLPEDLRRKLDRRQEKEDSGLKPDEGFTNQKIKSPETVEAEMAEAIFQREAFQMEEEDEECTPMPPEGVQNDGNMAYQHVHSANQLPHIDAEIPAFMPSPSDNMGTFVQGTATPGPNTPYALRPETVLSGQSVPHSWATPSAKQADQFAEAAESTRPRSRRPRSRRQRPKEEEIPLTTLLRNYLFLLARDRRNIAIAFLSILVLILALRPTSSKVVSIPLPEHSVTLDQSHGQNFGGSPSITSSELPKVTSVDPVRPPIAATDSGEENSYISRSHSRKVYEDAERDPMQRKNQHARGHDRAHSLGQAHDVGARVVGAKSTGDAPFVSASSAATAGLADNVVFGKDIDHTFHDQKHTKSAPQQRHTSEIETESEPASELETQADIGLEMEHQHGHEAPVS